MKQYYMSGDDWVGFVAAYRRVLAYGLVLVHYWEVLGMALEKAPDSDLIRWYIANAESIKGAARMNLLASAIVEIEAEISRKAFQSSVADWDRWCDAVAVYRDSLDPRKVRNALQDPSSDVSPVQNP